MQNCTILDKLKKAIQIIYIGYCPFEPLSYLYQCCLSKINVNCNNTVRINYSQRLRKRKKDDSNEMWCISVGRCPNAARAIQPLTGETPNAERSAKGRLYMALFKVLCALWENEWYHLKLMSVSEQMAYCMWHLCFGEKWKCHSFLGEPFEA